MYICYVVLGQQTYRKRFSLSQFDESGQFIVDLGRVTTLALAILWALPTL